MAALIELTDVNKIYPTGDEKLRVLNNVSTTVNAGEFVAIIGPSGSGKTTLSNVIGGLDTVDSGSVVVDGLDLAKTRDGQLSNYRNHSIGFVFQSFNLQPKYTTVENVMLPLILGGMGPKKRKARAIEVLQQVGLGDRLKHKATELSGGQRQRVAIARALANNPKIVIADEPTGNLDSNRGVEIMALLHELNQNSGITLLIVTHDMEIASQAGRVVEMHDGVLSEGSHTQTHAAPRPRFGEQPSIEEARS